jgi:hypothetical protein
VVAIVELVGEPEQIGEGQWGWRAPISPIVMLDPAEAPLLADAGVHHHQVYRRLDEAEYRRLRELLIMAV